MLGFPHILLILLRETFRLLTIEIGIFTDTTGDPKSRAAIKSFACSSGVGSPALMNVP